MWSDVPLMTQSPLRIAILGFGHHAVRRLLPAFARSKDTKAIGMWRRNQTVAAEDCAKHGIEHCFTSREELCGSPDVDAVFITSPDAMHLDDALLAMRNGKAVLCEKPLAMNASEAGEMVAAAKAAGVFFGVAQNFRYNRSVEFMREQIAAGLIGQPQIAQSYFCYAAQNAPRTWIADGSLACGGPIGDVGVHCVDALRYVLQKEALNVSTLARKDELSGDVEAYAAMQMEFTDGIYVNVVADARSPYRTLLEVTGTDGVLTAESGFSVDRPVEVLHKRGSEVLASTRSDNGDGYVRMLDGFAAAVRGEADFAATGEEGVLNMRVLDAAYRSWRSGMREMV
jgi:1,5-anhydro-D-fructose reductase (1,5-anhydro-D-mannitol-forming)